MRLVKLNFVIGKAKIKIAVKVKTFLLYDRLIKNINNVFKARRSLAENFQFSEFIS